MHTHRVRFDIKVKHLDPEPAGGFRVNHLTGQHEGEGGEYQVGLLLQKQVHGSIGPRDTVWDTARERLITTVELALNVKERVQFKTVKCGEMSRRV